MPSKSTIRAEIEKMCTMFGANLFLFKVLVEMFRGRKRIHCGSSSGTWLSDASAEDIFLPTDLSYLRTAISEGRFDKPTVTNDTTLRPSIETLIHALMPQRIVIHLHAIDVLSHLVRDDCDVILKNASKGF